MKYFIYRNQSILRIILISVMCFSFAFAFSPALAADPPAGDTVLGVLDSAGQGMGETAGAKKDLPGMIGKVIKVVLSILGIVFLIILIYAGIMWMTASGDVEKVQKAQRMITQAIIGLFITLAAYSISSFVVEKMSAATK
ncbi:hypothetical protein HQ571_01940 [Candidatus Kuenenbacteria bacterium]|nr:hypothetical protein [Candidatus Kuenenbacteria bacterium]